MYRKKTKEEESKNWELRKKFVLRRSKPSNNVLDRSCKFQIEDLFEFPKAPSLKPKAISSAPTPTSLLPTNPNPPTQQKLTRRLSEIFTINPNLNSNSTINTISHSNIRLRNYTYKPKAPLTRLKVVIGRKPY